MMAIATIRANVTPTIEFRAGVHMHQGPAAQAQLPIETDFGGSAGLCRAGAWPFR